MLVMLYSDFEVVLGFSAGIHWTFGSRRIQRPAHTVCTYSNCVLHVIDAG